MAAAVMVVVLLEINKSDIEGRAEQCATAAAELSARIERQTNCKDALETPPGVTPITLKEVLDPSVDAAIPANLADDLVKRIINCDATFRDLDYDFILGRVDAIAQLQEIQTILKSISDFQGDELTPVLVALVGRLSVVGLAFAGIYIFGSLYRYNIAIGSRYTAMADALIICQHKDKKNYSKKDLHDLIGPLAGAQDELFKGKQLMEHFTDIFGRVIDRLGLKDEK